ncbi:MAG: phosphoribosylformylglycinamidine synthase subunit PurQ [Halanaerobiales bacterium]|nr:phosphoribosylformylglycinamidine synthase subunit PurQ [Halanaerobiales bacterium]
MKAGVVTFPGSNCDRDVFHVLKNIFEFDTNMIWHKDENIEDYDLIVLPGGFSYGDYLRSGAIARFSRVMDPIIDFAEKGGLVLGICNGFQILLESNLLPGAMKVNDNLKFVCRNTKLTVLNNNTPFTNQYKNSASIEMPVAHGEGNYYIDNKGLKELKDNKQILLKYKNKNENPNGSIENIAGICNKERNIFGLMPHPERCSELQISPGKADGYNIFSSIISYINKRGDKVAK